MTGLELAVLVGVLLLAGGFVATRLRLPAPIVLIVLGVGLGFVPALGAVQLPPDLVLLLFLPALLYWESLNISVREMRRNARVVVSNAVPLVLATVAGAAALGHAAGLPWPVALTLGAIVAPTDATAVASVAGRLPRRTLTVLRAESLINDGTALAVYAVAVTAVTSESRLGFGGGVLRFLIAYGGGIAVGLAAAGVVTGARLLVRGTPLLENTVSVLTPFAAYLPGELLHVSGVIAVVCCGLVLSRLGPRRISAQTRTQAIGFWQLASWLLNGTLFLLVGFQAHRVLEGLGDRPGRVLELSLGVALIVVGVRVAWILFFAPYVIRLLDRRPVQRTRRVPMRQRTVSAWAGFRGAVSLAAALALPIGPAYERRDELIAITLVVILLTLLLQGLTLPAVVRWAQLPVDPTEQEEEREAELGALRAGLAAIPAAAQRLEVTDEVVERVRREYEGILKRAIDADDDHPRRAGRDPGESALRQAIISAKRQAVVDLRDADEIDDTVLRRIQARLDIEDLRLSPVTDE